MLTDLFVQSMAEPCSLASAVFHRLCRVCVLSCLCPSGLGRRLVSVAKQCSITLFQYALRGDLGTFLYLVTDQDGAVVRQKQQSKRVQAIDTAEPPKKRRV